MGIELGTAAAIMGLVGSATQGASMYLENKAAKKAASHQKATEEGMLAEQHRLDKGRMMSLLSQAGAAAESGSLSDFILAQAGAAAQDMGILSKNSKLRRALTTAQSIHGGAQALAGMGSILSSYNLTTGRIPTEPPVKKPKAGLKQKFRG